MSINQPSPPSYPLSMGKGIHFGDGTYLMIFGQCLPNTLSSYLATISAPVPWTAQTPTTLFDLTNIGGLNAAGDPSYPSGVAHYGINNEVITVLSFLNNVYCTGDVTITVHWYRYRDNQHVYGMFVVQQIPQSGFRDNVGGAFWIGWLSPEIQQVLNAQEIDENGDYYVTVTYSGGYSAGPYSADFAITGIPARTILRNPSRNGFDWKVVVSDYFQTSNYIRAGICDQPFTDGQSAQPSGIVDYQNAPAGSRGCAAVGTITGLSSVTTYTLYGFAQAANGLYYQAGSASITTLGVGRPANFSWTYSKVAGQPLNLTASEWNAFFDRINEFALYVGYGSPFSHTLVVAGSNFTASEFNYVRFVLYLLRLVGGLPGSKSAGDPVRASDLNAMVAYLNAIP